MRNINILINEDHTVSFSNDYAGLNRENLQGNIVFNFKNFVDGEARAEIIIDNQDGYILLDKVGETYTMPIKSSLLTSDFIIMQLVIDQPQQGEEYPVWKSETFTLKVGYSINATSQIPDDYPSWIEVLEGLKSEVETAVEQAENVNIESEQLDDGVKVITTDKYGNETTTIVPQGPQGEPGVPGAVKFVIVNELPTENIDESAIYLTPSENPDLKNHYDEWIWVVDRFEPLGETQIEVDLTDYVKNTDYASTNKGGVIKVVDAYGYNVSNSNGGIYPTLKTYAQYQNLTDYIFIGKGTLENVITGKGLVSNTDYATSSTGGVLKISSAFATQLANGVLIGNVLSNANYESASNNAFVTKGTLDNVLTATIGDIQTLLDNLDSGSGV